MKLRRVQRADKPARSGAAHREVLDPLDVVVNREIAEVRRCMVMPSSMVRPLMLLLLLLLLLLM